MLTPADKLADGALGELTDASAAGRVAALAQQLALAHENVAGIFQVLHGYYGNLLLSRYTTGRTMQEGPLAGMDEGIVNAREKWAYALRRFDGDTIKRALRRAREQYLEYPPTLPQFEAICAALAPRRTLGDADAVVKIPMAGRFRSEHVAKVRDYLARATVAELTKRAGYVELSPGLDGLKQAIAQAVRDAGGDAAATLVRLDRQLTPRAEVQGA